MPKIYDLTGQKFNRLFVLNKTDSRCSDGALIWLCVCDCGNLITVRAADLKSNHTKSCGCLRVETSSTNTPAVTHGMSDTVEYGTRTSMIQRCTNPNSQQYSNYGGRGIKVCDRWLNSFENFYADMGPRPSPEHSLDRYPNNDGNYEPGNCRWATKEEQCNNTRNNINIVYQNKQYTVAQLARESNIGRSTIVSRLNAGWDIEDVIKKPIRLLRGV